METTYTFEFCIEEVKIIAEALSKLQAEKSQEAARVEIVKGIFEKNAAHHGIRV